MEIPELSAAERSILSQDPYAVVKRLATIIDASLVRTLNKGDRIDISR